jgi:hypothetical protein
MQGSGNRPVTIDSAVNIKGETGGWAVQHGFIGSSGTNRGGFGALGSADALTYYYIGSYGSELFKIDTAGAAYVNGKISVGTTYAGFAANIAGTVYVISGNIIPSATNTYTLGSPDKIWKSIYMGPGTLNISNDYSN